MPNSEPVSLDTNPDEQEDELELEPEVEPTDGDPLDKIEDIEILRSEAKKFRSMEQRHNKPKVDTPKKEEPVVEQPKVEPQQEFLSKKDFELSNQKKAIRLATVVEETDNEEVKALKTDVLENWEQVRSYYTPRRGKQTPEDILEDIRDAFTLFRNRTPKKEDKPDTTPITETTVGQPSGTTPLPKDKPQDPPFFKLPIQPKDWYPKKS